MISVIVTSMDREYLEALLPQIADSGVSGEPKEIVVCSPYALSSVTAPASASLTWCPDVRPSGHNPAMRKALPMAKGEVVVALGDDIKLEPGWLQSSLSMLTKPNRIVAIGFGVRMMVFGYLYANYPLFHRDTALRHWRYFYPYCQSWGDPSFSLAVWESGGDVVQGTDNPIMCLNRDGHPETWMKQSRYLKQQDTRMFLDQHRATADAWMLRNWHLFNHDERSPQKTTE